MLSIIAIYGCGECAMYMRCAAALVTASLIGGCAIHPVPEDVTGLDTPDIVKQIRCETRDAARAVMRRVLASMAKQGDVDAQALLVKFQEQPDLMVDFDPKRDLPGADRRVFHAAFEAIRTAGIAYTFELTMTEDNNLLAGANFLGPSIPATVTLGLTGNFDRKRQNVRTFTITDRIGFLLRELNNPNSRDIKYCDGHVAVAPNYIYPIAGRVGIDNTVYTFFQLSFFDGLAGKAAEPGAVGAPSMADKLTFTTILDVSALPRVVFSPVSSGFQPTDASGTGLLRRTDGHQVSVGIALEPKVGLAALTSLRGFVFSGAALGGTRVAVHSRTGGGLLLLNRVTAATTSYAEQLAVLAIDQLKSRELQVITTTSP